ncbi:MAG: hypothetical protein JO040_03140, partial [Gemmatimonadetes bacterium]|nr:hypothetical protein [Gemmatimonadota bacterium]
MIRALLLALLLLCVAPVHAPAQGVAAADPRVEAAIPAAARARPGVRLDPEAATRAYLATVPPAERARSDAYFEGGYWIRLWSFLLSAAVLLLVLAAGWSRRMRDRAERITRRRSLQVFVYWVQLAAVTTLLGFPLDV